MKNARMKTIETNSEALADLDALLQHLADKTPVEPELARRVEERSSQAIEELRRNPFHCDIEQLLRDAREEA